MLWMTGMLLASGEVAVAEMQMPDPAPELDDSTLPQPVNIASTQSWLGGSSRPDQMLYFSGLDVWRFGYGGYVGAVWSPASFRGDGLLVRMFAASGIDTYRSTQATYRSETLRASLMPGWRISRDKFELGAYAGLDFVARIPLPMRTASPLRPNVGMRIGADVWWEPISAAMISGSLSMGTVEASANARVAAGIRLKDWCWAGPEISASSDTFGEQYRVGAHLTGLRVSNYEFSAAAGYAFDSFGRSGAYGRLGVSLRQDDLRRTLP